ncbi:MAG: hypothetical protein A2849_03975 [Candidatus Taylorbacteria bacterium RIFCSPHIGHO2_01_FULL_51_15]|uniref:Aminoglycoside phosphotransferase domain-containing protein n=1 Tax=Candidatus Taylorbacteria bacterium RIFCSPHIGHO2_01_FULL_51_15 TaxID=1802304 RepID=A0A1G2MET1_9BACT|nr:MAG: hypothetical protein A2849_03975 [Candidatus Taylorbacteria bacterium RIFCSPHIGHO2_01_FULL_51_15]
MKEWSNENPAVEQQSVRRVVEDNSVENLREVIGQELPDLIVHDAHPIGEGADNTTIEVNREYVFRFPRKGREHRHSFEEENKVLKALRGKTTTRLPEIEFEGKTYQWSGYKKIPGVQLKDVKEELTDTQREQLAKDAALFLFELHNALPISEAAEFGLKRPRGGPSREKLSDIRQLVNREFPDEEMREFLLSSIDRYEHMLGEASPPQGLLHGDFHPGNIVVNPDTNRLNGVIDFGEVAIGDVYVDFAYQFARDKDFAKAMMEEYSRLSGVEFSEDKMKVYGVMRILTHWHGDPKRVVRAKQWLEKLAVMV